MAEHEATAPRIDNPAVRHETTDVDLRRIAYWSIGFAIGIVLALAFLLFLFHLFNARETKRGHGPIGIPQAAPTAPAPQLQLSPRNDLAEMRAAEEKILRSYGWVDKQKGIVRIPIERAMEITAERAKKR